MTNDKMKKLSFVIIGIAILLSITISVNVARNKSRLIVSDAESRIDEKINRAMNIVSQSQLTMQDVDNMINQRLGVHMRDCYHRCKAQK